MTAAIAIAFSITDPIATQVSTPAITDEDITQFVKAHCKSKRLGPWREAQILKSALKDEPPKAPGYDECCGNACTPCVKDLWREEDNIWRNARGLPKVTVPTKKQLEF